MKGSLKIYVDGACSGNPGPAGIGIALFRGDEKLKEISKNIGEATNNIAEYTALIYALQEALILKADAVEIITDSELMCRQVNGEYKVKNPNIRFLFDQVTHLKQGFRRFDIRHVLRENNKDADRLAREAIKKNNKKDKKKQTKMVAPLFDHSGEESPSSTG